MSAEPTAVASPEGVATVSPSTATTTTTAVAPPAAPPTIESLQAQIAKQKETMRSWKENVKSQLMEAQSKNRALKEERDGLRCQLVEAELSVRTQLTEEYKERFAAKDDEIRRATEQLATSRAQRQSDAEEHLKILERQKEQFQKESQTMAADANATFNNELMDLEKQLKASQQETAAVQHELSVQVAKTTSVEQRLREATTAAAASAAAEGTADKILATRLGNELRIAQQELATARGDVENVKRRLIDVQEASAIATSQRVQEEVQQRDDQLNVLQVLLRQCQTDVGVYQQRCVALQGQLEEERDAREGKLSSIRHDLLAKLSVIEELTKSRDAIKANCTALEAAVALLEEEKEIRERAFAEIFLSDDQKEMVKVLEDQLCDSQQRAAEAAEAMAVLERELSAAKEQNVLVLQEASNERLRLAEQSAEIDAKLSRLSAQEKRTKDQCEQLAAQAERLRVAMGGAAAAQAAKHGGGGGSSSSIMSSGARGGGVIGRSSSAVVGGTASVPILEVGEDGRLREEGGGSGAGASGGGVGSAGAGGETLTASIDAFIQQLRAKHHWADVATNVVSAVNTNIRNNLAPAAVRYQQLSTYQQYRRLLPVIAAICFVSTFFYYWLFSSTSVKAGQTLRAVEVQETVHLVKQQYNALVEKYNQCCSMKAVPMPMDGVWKTK